MTSLTREELRELHGKRDLPGLIRISVQLVWFASSFAAAVWFLDREPALGITAVAARPCCSAS